MDQPPRIGTVGWFDLTVSDADRVRDFYKTVVGWAASDVPMGSYSDYSMHPPDGAPVAGVCHARGANANIPPVWLMYITVADLETSIAKVKELGGTVVDGPRAMGGRMCVIRDPAGAVCALFQPAAP